MVYVSYICGGSRTTLLISGINKGSLPLCYVNDERDSLLKAGYMGTVLVMSEASYLDSGDDANSVDKNTQ